MNDKSSRSTRLRYTATGALAALVAAGAIAGTVALAASPHTNKAGHAAAASGSPTKTPGAPIPDKANAPRPAANPQLFLNAVQRLVDAGTITATEGQTVDREIMAGRIDTETLTASGFTPSQLDAVQQALGNAKRSLAAAAHGTSK
jgi:hypothetical protein